MIDLGLMPPAAHAMWTSLIDLVRRQPSGWTLVGAQMVALHALEKGQSPLRASEDADVLVDVRAVQDGTERLSCTLEEAGFDLDGASPTGLGHRFTNGIVRVDVLAPDGLGPRAKLTTIPPAHTLPVPGGSQALRRSEPVDVRLGGAKASLPRPNLLGAILIKARAIDVDDAKESQRQDLAFLLGLVEDPRVLAEDLRKRERGWLKARTDLLDRSARAWRAASNAEDAYRALRILADV